MKKRLSISGPGVLVAAAFIGPGTVATCTIAGATYGYALLWALVLSIIATIVLQEMAARIGLISGNGLSKVIREYTQHPVARVLSIGLILSAIGIGNGAYEAGNISGGVLGLEALGLSGTLDIGGLALNYWSIIIGLLAGIILFIGNYKLLERILVSLVIVMSLAFVITAIVTQPSITGILKGSLLPQIPEGSLLTIVALVGTTVVPYNLFLHASLVREKWQDEKDLAAVRRDTRVAIIVGGLVSMSIIICAATVQGSTITSASDLAKSLQPLFGDYATYFIGIGLGAAGLTSAITAPLAAAYVVKGCLGWENDLKSNSFRMVWILVLIAGVVFSSVGFKPITIIKFAQITNGIVLPLIAGYLIWLANKKSLLGKFTNSKLQNVLSIVIWLIVLGLGLRSILKVFGAL